MESQQTWQADSGIINLWERAGITVLHDAIGQGSCALPIERLLMPVFSEPPVSLDDYRVERRADREPCSIDELTVRQALLALGLNGRVQHYPEWVRAEAWLFVALRTERELTAVEILARAHDLGLSQSSIEHARVRLGVVVERDKGGSYSTQRWRLPATIATDGTPADVDPRWRRFWNLV
jgi:hypothetical protein